MTKFLLIFTQPEGRIFLSIWFSY